MTDRNSNLDDLLTRIEKREQASKRNVLLWTAIPIVAALALLGYSSWRLATASAEVQVLKAKAITAKKEVAGLTVQIGAMREEASTLREQLEATEKLLRETLEFSQFRFNLDPVDVKMISSRFPREARILRFIIDMRESDVGWHLGGRTPQQGFDSPGFAEYVLREFNPGHSEATPGLSLVAASRRLFEVLPEPAEPAPGDLAFYPSGYVMFYFLAKDEQPFVIGMTPFGIAAFKPDFARVLGYRRSPRP